MESAIFRSTFENAVVGIAHVDAAGRWLRVNHRLCEIVGYSHDELLHLTFQDITHPDDLGTDLALLQATLAGKRPGYAMEKRYLRKDGSTVWINLTVSLQRDAADLPEFFIAVVEDISARKTIESALRRSEERHRLAVRAFHGAPYESHLDTGVGHRDPRAYEMLGEKAEDGFETRKWWFDRIHLDDLPPLKAAIQDLIEGRRQDLDIEYRIRHRDGHWVWLWQRGILQTNDAGQPRRLFGALLDITARKAAEAALKDSERLKGAMLAASLDPIVTIDAGSRIVEWNPAAEAVLGWPRAEAVGRDIADTIIPPDWREAHRRGMAHYLATGDGPVLGRHIEVVAQRRDGGCFPAELAITPFEVGGQPHFTAFLRDITSRKSLEHAQRESERRLRQILDNVLAFVGRLTPDGVLVEVNRPALSIAGLERGDVVGKPFWDCFWWSWSEAVRDQLREAVRRAAGGEIVRYDVELRIADGALITIDFQLAPKRDEAGRIAALVASGVDITERKKAEAQQALLARELQHRVKNTLAMVHAIVSQSLRHATGVEEARDAIQARLTALAQAHNSLIVSPWQATAIGDLVDAALMPHQSGTEHFRIEGDTAIRLGAKQALALSLALHELATNAAKYGSLSVAGGSVDINWALVTTATGQELSFQWKERDGPPVWTPTRVGFGSRMIERVLGGYFSGAAKIAYEPDGVRFTLIAPLDGLS